jgi:phosphoglycolate phosphatase-like HAD superfamily hydrolase
MRDLGRIRQGITQRAKEASQQVAATVTKGLEAQGLTGRDPDPVAQSQVAENESDEGASPAEVTQEVGRLTALLQRRRPMPGPVVGRWSIGIGDLVAEHPKVPSQLHGLVRTLDRYGGLAISERSVAFDGDEIEWSSVTEVRTRNVVEYLLSDAAQQLISHLPVPWFPGRRQVLDAISQALLTLLVATARQQLERPEAALRIPAEIHYRGGVRRERELAPGLLAALALADPAVNQCLTATAQAHQIVVRPADDAMMVTADQRAAQLRARLGELEAKMQRWRSGAAAKQTHDLRPTGYPEAQPE